MTDEDPLDSVRSASTSMAAILGLAGSPVGVRLLAAHEELPGTAQVLKRHRYCQALMKARHGQEVLLLPGELACPAAAAAFGFRPLPDKLASGDGLVGFGIVSEPSVGQRMFEGMPRLAAGQVRGIHLFPLEQAEHRPDVVVVEDEVERLMWLVLSYLHSTGGARVQGSTAVLQATCVDATLIPYLEQRLNFCLGCYGCRDATDIGANETVLGFPLSALADISRHLAYLKEKAMPVSRSKRAWQALA